MSVFAVSIGCVTHAANVPADDDPAMDAVKSPNSGFASLILFVSTGPSPRYPAVYTDSLAAHDTVPRHIFAARPSRTTAATVLGPQPHLLLLNHR